MLAVVGLILVVVATTLVLSALKDVSGAPRILVGAGMGLAIAWLGSGYFRYLTNPPPPEPELLPLPAQLGLFYVCEMCGMELAVVAVAKEKAPRHCGEAMTLIRRQRG